MAMMATAILLVGVSLWGLSLLGTPILVLCLYGLPAAFFVTLTLAEKRGAKAPLALPMALGVGLAWPAVLLAVGAVAGWHRLQASRYASRAPGGVCESGMTPPDRRPAIALDRRSAG